MSLPVRYLPEVAEDAREAADWYAQHGLGLRQRFRDSIKMAVLAVREKPGHYRCVHGEFRRVLLRRFPYALWFRLHNETVIVVCIFHSARDPGELRKHLENRWSD